MIEYPLTMRVKKVTARKFHIFDAETGNLVTTAFGRDGLAGHLFCADEQLKGENVRWEVGNSIKWFKRVANEQMADPVGSERIYD